jgi:RimJ/RimL family protein N-acetyltransferase
VAAIVHYPLLRRTEAPLLTSEDQVLVTSREQQVEESSVSRPQQFRSRILSRGRSVILAARSERRSRNGVWSETVAQLPAVDAEPGAVGELVRDGVRARLRRHVPANRPSFQRWYADPEIAYLLRHDLKPLSDRQSRSYFDTIILPLSARGFCFAIHETENDFLIGTAALTDAGPQNGNAALFRIVIGEKDYWERGYGSEATRLVVDEAFRTHGLDEVRLEVFKHNPRAIAAYEKVGFVKTGQHVELVPPEKTPLHVEEMALTRADYEEESASPAPDTEKS